MFIEKIILCSCYHKYFVLILWTIIIKCTHNGFSNKHIILPICDMTETIESCFSTKPNSVITREIILDIVLNFIIYWINNLKKILFKKIKKIIKIKIINYLERIKITHLLIL